MKKAILLLSIGLLLFFFNGCGSFISGERPDKPAKTIDPASERMTNTGKVVGFKEDNNAHAWLGIPYAKAPFNELRWKAPLTSV